MLHTLLGSSDPVASFEHAPLAPVCLPLPASLGSGSPWHWKHLEGHCSPPYLPPLQLGGLLRCNFHSSELPGRIRGGRLGLCWAGPPSCAPRPAPLSLEFTDPSPAPGVTDGPRKNLQGDSELTDTCPKARLLLGWAKAPHQGPHGLQKVGDWIQSGKQPQPCLLLLNQGSPALSDSVLRRPTGGEEILGAEFSPELPPCPLLAMTAKPVSWPGLRPTESIPGWDGFAL